MHVYQEESFNIDGLKQCSGHAGCIRSVGDDDVFFLHALSLSKWLVRSWVMCS